MDPHSRAAKKNTSHGNEVLQDYASITKTMLPNRKCVPNSAGNETTQRPLDRCKEMQTAVVLTCSPKSSCKAHWKGEEDKADKGRGGKTTSRPGQAWSWWSPIAQWRKRTMEKTSCKVICGAPITLIVKESRWKWRRVGQDQSLHRYVPVHIYACIAGIAFL